MAKASGKRHYDHVRRRRRRRRRGVGPGPAARPSSAARRRRAALRRAPGREPRARPALPPQGLARLRRARRRLHAGRAPVLGHVDARRGEAHGPERLGRERLLPEALLARRRPPRGIAAVALRAPRGVRLPHAAPRRAAAGRRRREDEEDDDPDGRGATAADLRRGAAAVRDDVLAPPPRARPRAPLPGDARAPRPPAQGRPHLREARRLLGEEARPDPDPRPPRRGDPRTRGDRGRGVPPRALRRGPPPPPDLPPPRAPLRHRDGGGRPRLPGPPRGAPRPFGNAGGAKNVRPQAAPTRSTRASSSAAHGVCLATR